MYSLCTEIMSDSDNSGLYRFQCTPIKQKFFEIYAFRHMTRSYINPALIIGKCKKPAKEEGLFPAAIREVLHTAPGVLR